MKMRKNKMKTFMGLLCAVTMGASVVMMSGCLDGSGNSSSSGNQEDSVQATSYVSLDINPSIELTLDAENKVISVYGGNEDGQVLLYEETGIIGEDVQIAVDKIVDLAVELGYLDENNKVISTNVVSDTQATVTELLSKIDATYGDVKRTGLFFNHGYRRRILFTSSNGTIKRSVSQQYRYSKRIRFQI